MSERAYRRMRRYAAFAVVHLAVVLVVFGGGVGGAAAGLAVLAASLPLLFALGLFQADVAMNPSLDEVARGHWRIALWLVPWSIALYWLWYVRAGSAAR
jgi:hypothetical protein